MSSLPFTPPRRTSSRNALIFADNIDDDIDTTTPFPVHDARPSSPSPSTSDFSVIGADEAEASARDLDYNNSFWSYNTGTPYRGGSFGSFGRRVIYSTPTLNLLSSYNGGSTGDYVNEGGPSAGVSGSGSGSGSGASAALKSLFPRLWDVLVSSPTRNILSTSSSPNNSPNSHRHRNSSYFGTPSYSNSHVHTHTHPYAPSPHANTNASGGRLTKSRNNRAWEGRQCNCANVSRGGGYYDFDGHGHHHDGGYDNPTHLNDHVDNPFLSTATATTAFSLIPDVALDQVPSPSSFPADPDNPRHSLSSQYSYININFSDLPPLDGEEGELIDIDIEDEACYVPVPYGGGLWRQGGKGSFSRARVVTGLDILGMLPTEIALVVLEMLVVATSTSANISPSTSLSKSEAHVQADIGGVDSRNEQGTEGDIDRRKSVIIHHNYQRASIFGLSTGGGALVMEYPPPYIPSRNYTPEQALRDLITCTQVSKRWRELAIDNSVWKAAYEGRWGAGVVGGGITSEKSVLEGYVKKQEEMKKRKQKDCCLEFWDDEIFTAPSDPDAKVDVNDAPSGSGSAAGSSSRSTISTASPSPSLDYHLIYKERQDLDKRWAGSALEKKVTWYRHAVSPLSIPPEYRKKMGIKRKKRDYQPLNVDVQGEIRRGGTVYLGYNFEEEQNEKRPVSPEEVESDEAYIKRMNDMIQNKRFERPPLPVMLPTLDTIPTKTTASTRAIYTRSRPSFSASTWSNVDPTPATPTTMNSWEVTSPVMGRSTSSHSDSLSPSPRTRLNNGVRPSHHRSPSATVSRRGWAGGPAKPRVEEEDESSSSSESGSGSGSGSGAGSSSGSRSLSSVSTLRARARNYSSRAFGSRSRSRGGVDAPSPAGKDRTLKKGKQRATESPKAQFNVEPQSKPFTPEEREKEKEREIYRLLKGTVNVASEEWEKWEPKVMRISGHVDSVYCIELPTSSETFGITANEYKPSATLSNVPMRSAEMNKIFVTGSRDRTIKMWSLKTGRCLGTFGVRKDGHMGEGLVLSGGPPGVRMSGAEKDDGPLTEEDRLGHKGSVLCLKFIWEKYGLDADEREQWKDGGVKQRWSMWKGKEKEVDEPKETKIIGRRGVMLSGSSDNTICVWDVWEEIKLGGEGKNKRHSGAEADIDEYEEDDPEDVAYQQYEMKARVRKVLRAHTGGVLDLRVDDNWIVSCSKDTTIRVWNRSTLQMHRIMRGHEGPVNAVGMVEGKVVSASGDGKMILWDVKSGERLRTFEGHDRGLACVEYKGDLIISGSNDCKIKMWSAGTGQCLCTLEGHAALVRALAYDPSSGRLVSVSYDKSVRVWDVKDIRDGSRNKSGSEGRLLREFRNAHTSQIFDVRFDLSRIVSTSHDHTIVVADFESQLNSAELFV
ncbi:hypothetical protein D9758_005385 [Tetrapyrgos nigripes]|uniref:F-box domain-containing protein n=1 Tax=Tetrapyrgos nigripes TaxID=182062 RepID=A0A8H5LQ02_9AGAR|nr:hypothetical protein D9758_005385 [Tetrapyrgos nigripes]